MSWVLGTRLRRDINEGCLFYFAISMFKLKHSGMNGMGGMALISLALVFYSGWAIKPMCFSVIMIDTYNGGLVIDMFCSYAKTLNHSIR